MEQTGYIHIVPESKAEKAHTIRFSGPAAAIVNAIGSIPAMQQEIAHLRADNERLFAACKIVLPYAKADAAEVLRAALAHAKGGA